jgi:hypothetical protein
MEDLHVVGGVPAAAMKYLLKEGSYTDMLDGYR